MSGVLNVKLPVSLGLLRHTYRTYKKIEAITFFVYIFGTGHDSATDD